jgi:hypothetical protein
VTRHIPFLVWLATWIGAFFASVVLATALIASHSGGSILVTLNDYGEMWLDFVMISVGISVMCIGGYLAVMRGSNTEPD